MNFKERCSAEATSNVIFLFQSRDLQVVEMPYGWEFDENSLVMIEEDADYATDEEVAQFIKYKTQDKGLPYNQYTECPSITVMELYKRNDECIMEIWRTETVWLSREEATEWGKNREYNYSEGWKVYAVCAKGELAKLIQNT